MRSKQSPDSMRLPSRTRISSTIPTIGAVIVVSIFIASVTINGSPFYRLTILNENLNRARQCGTDFPPGLDSSALTTNTSSLVAFIMNLNTTRLTIKLEQYDTITIFIWSETPFILMIRVLPLIVTGFLRPVSYQKKNVGIYRYITKSLLQIYCNLGKP